MKMILRRFRYLGKEENFHKLEKFISKKNLSRADVIYLLSNLELRDEFKERY